MSKIFIGVGHGGGDPGAVGNGLKEKDVNLSIALHLRDELKRHGVTVGISRTADEDDPTSEEVKECNAFAPDYAVDIHTNAGGGNGFEVYHTLSGGKGKTLAQNIEAEVAGIGQKSRGLKTRANSAGKDYFGFIRQTKCPAVILECAFIDSEDARKINTEEKRKAFAVAYAKGILKTLGIAYAAAAQNGTVQAVKQRYDLAEETMAYLRAYSYADDLLERLAAVHTPGKGASAEELVRTRFQFAEETMDYLKAYTYGTELLDRLAAG